MTPRIPAKRSDVPFLHDKQIEAEAELLIAEYELKFERIAEPPIPVDEMVELHLQLTLEFKDMKAMFPFADVHGAIWFEERRIGIDISLDPATNLSRRGRYHFTLAHEMGHWRLHRQHYVKNPAERMLFDDGSRMPDVVCRSTERKKPVELQADRFAANLLMPRKLVHAAWVGHVGGDGSLAMKELRSKYANMLAAEPFFYRGRMLTDQEAKDDSIKEEFCRPLAELFQVSPEAMRIRLETLNLLVTEKQPTLFT